MSVKDSHPLNVSNPIFTLSGITRLLKEVQPLNALSPMLVTLLGITRLLNERQPSNAFSPMVVTLSGIITLFKDSQPRNALSPMLVTLSGMTYDVASLSLNAIIAFLFLSTKTLSS